MAEDKNFKIAKNTGLLYFRSLICLLLSLYSSRLILQALGVEDFGIYNAVGGLASMFWIVSSALSSAVGRFLNYEMGRENPVGINEDPAKLDSTDLLLLVGINYDRKSRSIVADLWGQLSHREYVDSRLLIQ